MAKINSNRKISAEAKQRQMHGLSTWRKSTCQYKQECKRCTHKWKGFKEQPTTCPRCHSALWRTARTRAWNGARGLGYIVPIAIPEAYAMSIQIISNNTGESKGSIAAKYLAKGGLKPALA